MFFFFGFVSCISTVTCYSSVRFTPYAGLQLLMSFWVWDLTELPWWLPCFHRKVAPSFNTVKEPTPNQYKNLQNSPVQTHRLYLKRGWYFSLHPFVDGSKWGVQTCCITLVCVDHDAWCSPGWNSLTGKYNTRSYQMNNSQREVVLLGG